MIDVVVEERLPERAAAMGARLRPGLEELATRHPVIGDIRGRGLLVGVELVIDRATREPADDLGGCAIDACLARGLSMNIVRHVGANSAWRITPPLTMSEDEVDLALSIMNDSLAAVSPSRFADRSALDAQRPLHAMLREVHEVAAQDSHRRLGSGVDADRRADFGARRRTRGCGRGRRGPA